jgi:hypothetical protein
MERSFIFRYRSTWRSSASRVSRRLRHLDERLLPL